MITIEINRKFYSIPQKWNELSSKQLLQVMDLFYCTEYTLEKAQLKLLKILSGMSWWEFFRAPVVTIEKQLYPFWKPVRILSEWLYLNRKVCYGLDEYLYLTYFTILENDLTKAVLKEYKGLYGPADSCSNMKMDEFVFSEHYYTQWAEEKMDDDFLNNLVSVLYRPEKEKYDRKKNIDGDCRIAFNENLCQFYADTEIKKWPLKAKMAVAHFYEACRQQWIDSNPDVFGGDGEPAKYGLLSVMRGVAKSGVHGDIENVEKKYVNAILVELNELVAEAKEIKKAMKK